LRVTDFCAQSGITFRHVFLLEAVGAVEFNRSLVVIDFIHVKTSTHSTGTSRDLETKSNTTADSTRRERGCLTS
jgi:hypothetical protein